MSASLILDIMIVLLLIPTICYAVILNKRLQELRKSRGEFSKLIEAFNQATVRAEQAIPKLKHITGEAGRKLQDQVDKAHNLRDDLAFMIETAESTADRLENMARVARKDIKKVPSAGLSDIKQTGLPNLKKEPVKNKKEKTLFDSLDKASGFRNSAKKNRFSDEDNFTVEDERSEAERELLKALQSAR